MTPPPTRRRARGAGPWRALTPEQKQARLAGLRARQQHQVEVEMRRLAALL